MSTSTSPRSKLRSLAAVGVASLTVLVATVAGTGTASAADGWQVQIINANVPSGTGAVRVEAASSGKSACVPINTSSKTTNTSLFTTGGWTVTVQGFGNSACTGTALSGAITYRPEANDDRRENNLDCTWLALGVRTAEHHFRVCS